MKLSQILGVSISSAVAIILVLSGRPSQSAGPLTPVGPPAPTMVSLDELASQIAAIQTTLSAATSSGKNVGAIGTGAAAVWDSGSSNWDSINISTPSGTPQIIESNGNFCAVGSSVVAAWSNETKNWYSRNLTGPSVVAGSNGNFCVKGTSVAAAWNQVTKNWTSINLDGSGKAAGADH